MYTPVNTEGTGIWKSREIWKTTVVHPGGVASSGPLGGSTVRVVCAFCPFIDPHCLIMDLLDVSFVFPGGWQDVNNINNISSLYILAHGGGGRGVIRQEMPSQSPPPPTHLCTGSWPPTLSFPRKWGKHITMWIERHTLTHTGIADIQPLTIPQNETNF